MRTTLVTLLATLSLLSCGGSSMPDAGPPVDAGPTPDMSYCVSDGTPLGDCHHFDCLIQAASATYCGAHSLITFDCTELGTFPPAYQTQIQAYFNSCGPKLSTFVDTDVPVGMGMTAHVTACDILNCSRMNDTAREYMCMAGVMQANCAPVPTPDCDFPDYPGYVCM